ncbi:MAG: TIR domain-containing protein [Candidatus Omnitrophica bacterium]|nr:TIR domain-containing protein [Candidatus Omnitrophota bacterium]
MNNLERLRLINQIAITLQEGFSTSQINLFLVGFGIPSTGEQIVPSKRVHVENKLSSLSESLIVKIAKELEIPLDIKVDQTHETISLKENIVIALESSDFSIIDLILDEYNTPRHNHYDFHNTKEYILFKINELSVDELYSINNYLNKRKITHDNPTLWGDCKLRVFISHLSRDKKKAKALAKELKKYNASGFVAHIDIKPNDEWLKTIESALESMDVLIALVTEGFKESDWTVQEIGFALGKGVPVVAIRNGMDPFGFFGKWQAIQGTGRLPKDIVKDFIAIIKEKRGHLEMRKD